MLAYFLDLAVLSVCAAWLAWASFRLWRSREDYRYVKWTGAALAALLALVVTAASVLAATALVAMNSRHAPVPNLTVSLDPESIQHGEAIATGFCSACHSLTGTLTGGMDVGKDFPVSLGSMVSTNLTPAGPLAHWTDGEIFRAIRNALDKDGRWLMIMSYTNASKLSDRDLESVIAYIRSQPPNGKPTPQPPDHLNLRGLLFLGAGLLPEPKPVVTGLVTAPPKLPTARYGEYILSYQDCRVCHGETLTGGTPGQIPPIGPDLSMVKNWTSEQFIATLRTGTDPGGHQLREIMPWRTVAKMDDVELTAMYKYLTALPATVARR
jgi:mono/diheme cytochrome c family protein